MTNLNIFTKEDVDSFMMNYYARDQDNDAGFLNSLLAKKGFKVGYCQVNSSGTPCLTTSKERHEVDTHTLIYQATPIKSEKTECQHHTNCLMGASMLGNKMEWLRVDNDFCPKCGEKLK